MAKFDLVNVNDSSPLVKQFKTTFAKASGQQVTAFIPQKMKKVAGESTKDLDFVLENGQTVTLVVRTDGDVVRVKINGKDTPLKSELFHFAADSFQAITPNKGFGVAANTADRNSHASVFAKAVAEIAEKVRQGQAAFDKRMSKERVVIPNSSNSGSGGGGRAPATTTAKTKEMKNVLEELDKEIVEKTAIRDDLKQRLAARDMQKSQVFQSNTVV